MIVATHDERLVPLVDRVVELTPRQEPPTGSVETLELDDGVVLFHQGDAGSLVYIVESGTIQLTRDRVDGTQELLDEIREGGHFGELAPLFKMPRSSTARALGKTVVTGLPLPQFRDVLKEKGTVGRSSQRTVDADLTGET